MTLNTFTLFIKINFRIDIYITFHVMIFYEYFFFFWNRLQSEASSKILIRDYQTQRINEFRDGYCTWSRDDKYLQVPQDLSAHLSGYLGFACRSTSTFVYFFFSPFDPTFRLTWRGFERIVLDIPILPDDPTIRDYRVPKTVLVLEKTVKLLESTKRTRWINQFLLWIRERICVPLDTINQKSK